MGGCFFLRARSTSFFTLHHSSMNTWTDEEHASVNEALETAFQTVQNHIAAAEQEGQIVFVKEHALTLVDPFLWSQCAFGPDAIAGIERRVESTPRSPLNITTMPDEFLKTWKPTFLIQHPAVMLPSLYRTRQLDFEMEGVKPRLKREPLPVETTLKWNRTLYEFYAVHFGADSLWPIVLDADDIMTSPELLAKYAKLVGLDPDGLCFAWNRANEEELNTMLRDRKIMRAFLCASSRIDISKVAGNIDIDAEAVKWRAEFGEEGGRKLEGWVRSMMPDYLALHAKRLKLE